ncbi:hypothetical protein HYR54_16655 [Candidatus Acetothermia bacterium]|nr:hypothetical protein [Candidatus Acetothermia bacterium]
MEKSEKVLETLRSTGGRLSYEELEAQTGLHGRELAGAVSALVMRGQVTRRPEQRAVELTQSNNQDAQADEETLAYIQELGALTKSIDSERKQAHERETALTTKLAHVSKQLQELNLKQNQTLSALRERDNQIEQLRSQNQDLSFKLAQPQSLTKVERAHRVQSNSRFPLEFLLLAGGIYLAVANFEKIRQWIDRYIAPRPSQTVVQSNTPSDKDKDDAERARLLQGLLKRDINTIMEFKQKLAAGDRLALRVRDELRPNLDVVKDLRYRYKVSI